MRYPEGHKDKVRTSIVKNAARALRRDGLAGVSIPALMKKAGLTHGGFYAHFKNRDELVAAAVLAAADETGSTVLSRDAGDVQATVNAYVSKQHVDYPERGCVLAALGGEGRHQTAPVRRAFALAARGFVRLVEQKLHPDSAPGTLSEEALKLSAQMIGAIVLARLVDDEQLAEKLLQAVRSQEN